MIVPTITIGEIKKESINILDLISRSGRGLSFSVFRVGVAMFFVMLVTSIALLFSGPLLFIGVIILIPFVLISTLAGAIMPIVMAGVADEYLLYSKGGLSIKSLVLGICFLISFLIIPYIGLLLLFVLFAYCFGLVSLYIKKEYPKYINR